MDSVQDIITQFNTLDLDAFSLFKIMLFASVICLLLGVLFKTIRGKQSLLNHAVCSALAIAMMYILALIVVSAQPAFAAYLPPLPFLQLNEGSFSIMALKGADLYALNYELLLMMILAFITNLLDTVIPHAQNFFAWLFTRILCVALSFISYLAVSLLFSNILPGFLPKYAPVIMVVLIVILLAVSVFKLIIGVILGITMGPVIGAVYTFFFSNLVGKQIVKAAVSTLLLCILVAVLNYLGYTAILLVSTALYLYIAAALILLLVWFFLYKFL